MILNLIMQLRSRDLRNVISYGDVFNSPNRNTKKKMGWQTSLWVTLLANYMGNSMSYVLTVTELVER